MKVLHINENLAPKGGVETYLLGLLPRLQALGWDAHVLYGKGEPEVWPASTAIPGISQIGFPEQSRVREEIRAALEREQPDLIHVHNIQNFGVMEACLAYGPTVLTSHDLRWICPANTYFHKRTQEICPRPGAGLGCFTTTLVKRCLTPRPRFASYFYYRTKAGIRHAAGLARVIAPSEGTRQRLIKVGFPADHVKALPYFCPLEPAAAPRPVPARPTITFLGRIAPNKGHEFFVEALGLLPADYQGFLVGSISDSSEKVLMDLARRHGCADRLVLHRWAGREEVLRLMDQTTVLIFPSLGAETLGLVGVEAMARGVPVVASDVDGAREWLFDGHNGHLVPPKNAAAIRDAVLSLTSSEARLRTLGQHCIDTIRKKFLPEQHTAQLVEIYQSVVGQTVNV